jgi:hypothetical protein
MRTIALESLSKDLRKRVLRALDEPILLTDGGEPVFVVRRIMDDDEIIDELIAQHPAFEASLERARQQKSAGQVKTLAELRQKYAAE